MSQPKTLYDKVFEDHIVHKDESGSYLLYIDRHLVHEVTSPQAFEGLEKAGRPVRRTDCTLATVDHNIPTTSRNSYKNISQFIKENDSRLQCSTLEDNVKKFGVKYFGLDDSRQGIVHVVGPEQGFTLPGTTVVCGDSHTSTHGAFGALAFGIGTSEVEHVLATQTIIQAKSKNMKVLVNGKLAPGITSKDLILHIIGAIGTAGGTGCVMEFCGEAISDLSIEARMSMCNMAIEGGARAGMIAPDDKAFSYLKGRPLAPAGAEWDKAVSYWKTLQSDPGAHFDYEVVIDGASIIPTVTWGNSPQDALPITGRVPDPKNETDSVKKEGIIRALKYQGLEPNMLLTDIIIDQVFIGSCTNSRLEDLRNAAAIVKGRKIASTITRAMVVPGSGLIKIQAEHEGLDKIFTDAGFEWREAGCSMCLGMNPDILKPQERCASTSNRNFEGRQGYASRTHLVSPIMAAAAAIDGHLTDARKYLKPDSRANSPRIQVALDDEIDNAILEQQKAPQLTPSTASQYFDDEVNDIPPTNDTPLKDDEVPVDIKESSTAPTNASERTGIPVFTVETGIAANLDQANIDTDAIIPKQFLKTIKRTGLRVGLFYEGRFKKNAKGEDEETDFVLNVEPWRSTKILVVTGPNFGCGSSREHAPWALADFGIRAIIAPSFGDIFYNNSFKNGLLPIRISQEEIVSKLSPVAKAGKQLSIDLVEQKIFGPNGEELIDHFDIEQFRKHCLINGLDDIGLTLKKEKYIKAYELLRKDKFSFLEDQSKKLMVAPVVGTKKSIYGVKAQEW